MFELPRGNGKGTVSCLHLGLMSLSNKSCVGLDAHQRQAQRKFQLERVYVSGNMCKCAARIYKEHLA